MSRLVIPRTLPGLRSGIATPCISRLNVRGRQLAPVAGCYRMFSKSQPRSRKMETVFSPDAVMPVGPYSQAIKANGLVFLSGQIPAEPSGKLIEGTITDKAHKMCQNASAVLEAAGSSLDKVVKVTIYFQDFGDFREVNEVYTQYFPHSPARTASESPRLPAGAPIEMDLIALQ
ncbi:Endoribonuclease L-PSP/chorismate mutase-like protein [Dactylonectria macrodidyma]|uniref:Endoribonuclease L-PSP/chorismate mutase-like protein n=1 Tax=Dactylonectria macrodidyma TaxID=307937 RepID=A0A9P9FWL2_9HYPO|nr:Endoribonuclease L-PSP/chorismate mutase-like protein [Dactylonectria macrodidyma]